MCVCVYVCGECMCARVCVCVHICVCVLCAVCCVCVLCVCLLCVLCMCFVCVCVYLCVSCVCTLHVQLCAFEYVTAHYVLGQLESIFNWKTWDDNDGLASQARHRYMVSLPQDGLFYLICLEVICPVCVCVLVCVFVCILLCMCECVYHVNVTALSSDHVQLSNELQASRVRCHRGGTR